MKTESKKNWRNKRLKTKKGERNDEWMTERKKKRNQR